MKYPFINSNGKLIANEYMSNLYSIKNSIELYRKIIQTLGLLI